MREMKSLLSCAGILKRLMPDENEDVMILRALMNVT